MQESRLRAEAEQAAAKSKHTIAGLEEEVLEVRSQWCTQVVATLMTLITGRDDDHDLHVCIIQMTTLQLLYRLPPRDAGSDRVRLGIMADLCLVQENNARRAAQGEADEARARTRQLEKELEQVTADLNKVTSLLPTHPCR